MSGTSLDGIDVVLADLAPAVPRVLTARTVPFEPSLRTRLASLCAPGAEGGAEDRIDALGEADTALGHAIGEAVAALLHEAAVPASAVRAIGSHGQTVRHRPPPRPDPFTLQLGDPNVVAERTGLPVVADFRRRDLAAGGQGAPLVPAFHAAVFGAATDRVVVNVGGMANVTLLPGGRPEDATGFDTGPGNVLLDAWARRHLLADRDEGGAWAGQATVDPALLARLLDEPYFTAPPPKSTGREHFDLPWLEARLAGGAMPAPAAVQATLTELTARTIADGIRAAAPLRPNEVLVRGGGRHNAVLMERLAAALPETRVSTTDAHGLDGDWVEAVAFAWLAERRLAALPGNLPAATGASGPRILGALYLP
jgi:anhydro-N-acetylmuramic acid kinase